MATIFEPHPRNTVGGLIGGPFYNCVHHGLSASSACPACADEPVDLSWMPAETKQAIVKLLNDANEECKTWSSTAALSDDEGEPVELLPVPKSKDWLGAVSEPNPQIEPEKWAEELRDCLFIGSPIKRAMERRASADIIQQAYARLGDQSVVLPPVADGDAKEWRDLSEAQAAETDALRASLERALGRIAELTEQRNSAWENIVKARNERDAARADRNGYKASAEQHAAELARYQRAAEAMVRPPMLTIDEWVNRPASVLPGKITYVRRRLSAGWEDQPCVTTGARVTSAPDPLLRAIGARPRAIGLLTGMG